MTLFILNLIRYLRYWNSSFLFLMRDTLLSVGRIQSSYLNDSCYKRFKTNIVFRFGGYIIILMCNIISQISANLLHFALSGYIDNRGLDLHFTPTACGCSCDSYFRIMQYRKTFSLLFVLG